MQTSSHPVGFSPKVNRKEDEVENKSGEAEQWSDSQSRDRLKRCQDGATAGRDVSTLLALSPPPP